MTDMETSSDVLRRLADALETHPDMHVIVHLVGENGTLDALSVIATIGAPEFGSTSASSYAKAEVEVGVVSLNVGMIRGELIGEPVTATHEVVEFRPYPIEQILAQVTA